VHFLVLAHDKVDVDESIIDGRRHVQTRDQIYYKQTVHAIQTQI